MAKNKRKKANKFPPNSPPSNPNTELPRNRSLVQVGPRNVATTGRPASSGGWGKRAADTARAVGSWAKANPRKAIAGGAAATMGAIGAYALGRRRETDKR